MVLREVTNTGNNAPVVLLPKPAPVALEGATFSKLEGIATKDLAAATEDPQRVEEYAEDIAATLARSEAASTPRPGYADARQDQRARYRATLVDWLVDLQQRHKLQMETLFLAVNLMDRYLDCRPVSGQRLQVVGAAAVLIASKFEEVRPPEVAVLVRAVGRSHTAGSIRSMELSMLATLNFAVAVPTAAHFLARCCRANRCSDSHASLVQYVLELTLTEIEFLRYPPSHLVSAATLLSNKLLQYPAWPPRMVACTKHTEDALKKCVREMWSTLERASRSPPEAIRRKFSLDAYHNVAQMGFQ